MTVDPHDYLPIVAFMLAGIAVAAAILTLSWIGPRKPSAVKSQPYESGILSTTPVRQRFSIDFYLTAMLFILFDIELAFLFPLAVVLREDGVVALVLLLVFTVTVVEALIYVWRKGALEWR